MSVKLIDFDYKFGKAQYIGLTTDIKPTDCLPGSTFQELDGSKNGYIFDGTSWYLI